MVNGLKPRKSVKVVEETASDSPGKEVNVLNDSQLTEFKARGAEGGAQEQTTPDTLRRDLRLMAQATTEWLSYGIPTMK